MRNNTTVDPGPKYDELYGRNALESIGVIRKALEDLGDLFVAKVKADQRPVSNEITKSQAQDEFGYRWINDRTRTGQLVGKRKGPHKNSPVIYLRTECIALKEAERLYTGQMLRKQKKG